MTSLCHITKGKFISKILEKCGQRTSSKLFFIYKELNATLTGKWKFRKKLVLLDIHQQNNKYRPKSSYRLPKIPSNRWGCKNKREPGVS